MQTEHQLGLTTLLGAGQGLNRRPCPAPHPGSLTAALQQQPKGAFYCGLNRGHF